VRVGVGLVVRERVAVGVRVRVIVGVTVARGGVGVDVGLSEGEELGVTTEGGVIVEVGVAVDERRGPMRPT
jgi:hypothetical protein